MLEKNSNARTFQDHLKRKTTIIEAIGSCPLFWPSFSKLCFVHSPQNAFGSPLSVHQKQFVVEGDFE